MDVQRWTRAALLAAALPMLLAGCDDPLPTAHDDDHGDATEDLHVELTLSPDHVHIYSEVDITVAVSDHHDEAVTDFEEIYFEYRDVGATEWDQVELALNGTVYTATHVFGSSGDHEVRVTGRRATESHPVVMHEMQDHLHAARAHAEADGYTVEFEAFPGHIHAGDTGTLRFWITERADVPVTGLAPEIHVTEGDGSLADYDAVETEAGVYEADHAFGSAGEAHAELHYIGSSLSEVSVDFHLEIAHAH